MKMIKVSYDWGGNINPNYIRRKGIIQIKDLKVQDVTDSLMVLEMKSNNKPIMYGLYYVNDDSYAYAVNTVYNMETNTGAVTNMDPYIVGDMIDEAIEMNMENTRNLAQTVNAVSTLLQESIERTGSDGYENDPNYQQIVSFVDNFDINNYDVNEYVINNEPRTINNEATEAHQINLNP